MKFISLTLRKVDAWEAGDIKFEDAIAQDFFVVLLGPPGSGKSSILEKFHSENPESSQMISVKRFLRESAEDKPGIEYLLLDGLDEYRCYSNNEKTSIIYDLAEKIAKKNIQKVALSCRELDWYGEIDLEGLRDVLKVKPGVFQLQPPSFEQKQQLAEVFGIEDIALFLDRYDPLGLLENPQAFSMVAEVHKENPRALFQSKKGLYESFFSQAKERNPTHKINSPASLEPAERLRLTGYLAAFFLFSRVDRIDDEFLDSIACKDRGFSKEQLRRVIGSIVFRDGRFAHRTLAEFAFPHFIVTNVWKRHSPRSLSRIKAFFLSEGRIPSELRGVYAWICSLSGNLDFVKEDPFHQTVYGDNSILSLCQKEKVISEVREHSKVNPYFFRHRSGSGVEGLYQKEMDSFLVREFETAITLDNHYYFFLANLIASCRDLSETMKAKIKSDVLDPKIRSYYKQDLIRAMADQTSSLLEILSAIKAGRLPDDEDSIKNRILDYLYPKEIGIESISEYLMLYHGQTGGYCHFLYKTPYERKKDLVTKILEESARIRGKGIENLPRNVRGFLSDYFLETCLKFDSPGGFSASEIFIIIKHFHGFLGPYEKFEFESFRYAVSAEHKSSQEKLKRLANELFAIYLDDPKSRENGSFLIYEFDHFFPLESPDRAVEILLSKLSVQGKTPDEYRQLFRCALSHSPKERRSGNEFRASAVAHGLEDELDEFVNPTKREWEIREERREKARENKQKATLQHNEDHFAKRQNHEILASFGDLHFIANSIYLCESFGDAPPFFPATLERLKQVLATAIYQPISPELLTLSSLAQNSPGANRNIDIVYYVSACLQEAFERDRISDGFKKYLYIVSIQRDKVSNVIKGKLLNWLENEDPRTAHEGIDEFLSHLYGRFFPGQASILKEKAKGLSGLDSKKKLVEVFGPEEGISDCLLEAFLRTFHLRLSKSELDALSGIECNVNNKLSIEALLLFESRKKVDFRKAHAVAIFSLTSRDSESLPRLDDSLLVPLLDYMFDEFPSEESIEPVSGMQTGEMCCASFLRNQALKNLSDDGLKALKDARAGKVDVWTNRIAHEISDRGQLSSDQGFGGYSIEAIKAFLFQEGVSSSKDFFEEVFFELCDYRDKIQDNRSRERNAFFDSDGTPKIENICRDVVQHFLAAKHGTEWEITPEGLEAENRVDLNIKYRKNPVFEVQVECKRDFNEKILQGIPDQLVKKYMRSDKLFGIYLVFFFGSRNKGDLLRDLDASTPEDSKARTRVILIDLSNSSTPT